jgi:hypothetical protein
MKGFFTILCLWAGLHSWGQVTIGVKLSNPLSSTSIITVPKATVPYDIETFAYLGVLQGGAFVRVPFSRHFTFHGETLFRTESVSFSPRGANWFPSERHLYLFKYLNMPLLLQCEGTNKFRGFGQLGIAPKFLGEAILYDKEEDKNFDVTEHFNRAVLDLNVGGGILWDLPRVVFMIDGRLSVNLTPMASKRSMKYLDFREARSIHVAISASAGLKIGKRNTNNKK